MKTFNLTRVLEASARPLFALRYESGHFQRSKPRRRVRRLPRIFFRFFHCNFFREIIRDKFLREILRGFFFRGNFFPRNYPRQVFFRENFRDFFTAKFSAIFFPLNFVPEWLACSQYYDRETQRHVYIAISLVRFEKNLL
jgi:hypothetical protein